MIVIHSSGRTVPCRENGPGSRDRVSALTQKPRSSSTCDARQGTWPLRVLACAVRAVIPTL